MADAQRLEELRRRVQKDPASLAFAQLAEECRRAGLYADAVRVCREGLAYHPDYLSARVTLGRALLALEHFDQAGAELAGVLRIAPENLAALRGLAEVSQRRGLLAEALEYYRRALALAPHDHEILAGMEALRSQGPAHADATDRPRPPLAERAPTSAAEPAGVAHPPALAATASPSSTPHIGEPPPDAPEHGPEVPVTPPSTEWPGDGSAVTTSEPQRAMESASLTPRVRSRAIAQLEGWLAAIERRRDAPGPPHR